jgi:hypothetical protein
MRQHQIVLNLLQLSGHHSTVGLRFTVFVAHCNRRPNTARVKRVAGKLLVEQVRALLTFSQATVAKKHAPYYPTDLAISYLPGQRFGQRVHSTSLIMGWTKPH